MKRRIWILSTISVLCIWTLPVRADEPDSAKMPGGHPSMGMMRVSHEVDTVTRVTDSAYRFVLEVRHRVFETFREIDTVYLNEKFSIGEGEEVGQVIVFNPHLIITDKGEYLKISDSLNNPAVRVRLYHQDTVIQQSWAFYYSDAPHFRRNDLLGFKLVSFEVPEQFIKVDGPPWMEKPAADSTTKPK